MATVGILLIVLSIIGLVYTTVVMLPISIFMGVLLPVFGMTFFAGLYILIQKKAVSG